MRLGQALELHLGSKVYTVNDLSEIEECTVVHLVYQGDNEIRVIVASSLGEWQQSFVNMSRDVYYSYEEACKACSAALITKKMSLQKQIEDIDKKLVKGGVHAKI